MHLAKKTARGKTYLYIATTERKNGIPVQKMIRSLGTADQLNAKLDEYESESLNNPDISLIYDFGAPAALYDIAQRIDLPSIIDFYIPKRNQGLPISTYLILAAINRAICPTSKREIYDWFSKTILTNIYPTVNKYNLSSQAFWNNIKQIDASKIELIEDKITKNVINMYNLQNKSLLLDNTNFFTYIDTKNNALIPQRGHSKEHRNDLKIVGLSLLVYPDYNIPLYHQTYPGNRNDSTQFCHIINSLSDRINNVFNNNNGRITIVFDKGNNSFDNIQLLENKLNFKLNFVGSLKQNQCSELLKIPKNDFLILNKDKYHGTSVYRTIKNIYGNNYTVLVTNNPKLYSSQLDGIYNDINKSVAKLTALDARLQSRASGKIKGGIKPTIESVSKSIKTILSRDYMDQIFDYDIYLNNSNHVLFKYLINNDKFDHIKEETLGKTIIFTNNHDWPSGDIVSAYRSQYHVENAFRELKNVDHMSYRPIRHFTDNNIRVHSFYCILSLLLTSIFQLEVDKLGYKMSKINILTQFSELQQVINLYSLVKGKNKTTMSFSKDLKSEEGVVNNYITKYNLLKYAYK